MTKNLYIASIEPGCGKSVITLGLMDLLAERHTNPSFFRPIISDRAGRDDHIELVRSRFCAQRPYESLYGVSHETARQLADSGKLDLLFDEIERNYGELDRSSDVLLCEGTDHTELATPFDFEFDALVANRLNCRVILVSSGRRRTPLETAQVACAAQDAFIRQGCQVAASIVSRVEQSQASEIRAKLVEVAPAKCPVFLIPEVEYLARVTTGQIARAIDAVPLFDESSDETAVVSNCRVAAMQLAHFLQYIDEGSLVITPGDRSDVILAALASRHSATYPNISGIVLTGGLQPPPDVLRLLEGFRPLPVPIYQSKDDTYTTAMKIHATRPAIASGGESQVRAALEAFSTSVDFDAMNAVIDSPSQP